MKRTAKTLLAALLGFLLCLFLLACDDGCKHRDANDDSLCDNCGVEYSDAKDIIECEHRDANDDSLCDKCSEGYTDGNDLTEVHTHNYDIRNTDSVFIVSKASCEDAATYFYSCSCGEKGTEVFFDRYSNGHIYTDGICVLCGYEGTPGLVYTLSGDTYAVTGTETDLIQAIIPPTYNGISVTAIAHGAFGNCKNLLSVEIGKNVTDVSASAFDGCIKLSEIINKSEGYFDLGAEDIIETHSGETKIKRVGDFWFYALSDIECMLVHFSGEYDNVVLPVNSPIDPSNRVILPLVLTSSDFESRILLPLIERIEALLETYCKASLPDANFNFVGNNEYNAYSYGCIDCNEAIEYAQDMLEIVSELLRYGQISHKEREEIYAAYLNLMKIISSNYQLFNPVEILDKLGNYEVQKLYKAYPITKDGTAIYVYLGSKSEEVRQRLSNIITEIVPEYDYNTMVVQEMNAGLCQTEKYTVDARAFKGVESITAISIMTSGVTFENNALSECLNLEHLYLGENATGNYTNAIQELNNSLTFSVHENNEYYIVVDGNLCSKDELEG